MSVPSASPRAQDEAVRPEIKVVGGPRFPLPGLLFALLAVALAHGPLLTTPPLYDEPPFLAGASESRGPVIGMQWLPLELALLGREPLAHRLFALALEAGLLALVAASPLVRRSRAPGLLLVALAAYLVHPFRTESFLRLGARPILVSEALLAGGLLLAFSARRAGTIGAGLLLVAAGTSGMPLALAFAVAALLGCGKEQASRARGVAFAALVGAGAWWLAAPPAAPLPTLLCGLERLARPWTTGLVHLRADPLFAAVGGAIVLALALLSALRRDRGALGIVAAALLAFVAAPALRPPRTGLEPLGAGITPEAWLVALALTIFGAWRLAAGGFAAKLPLLALAALALGGGLAHERRFGDEGTLLDHAIAVEPESIELRIAKGERLLRQIGFVPPPYQRDFAGTALETAQHALLRRPGDVAATTLQCVALALLGKLDEARERSDRLLREQPGDWRARASRAEIEALAGDDLAALSWLRSAVDARPTPWLRGRYVALVDRVYATIQEELAERRWDAARRRCERLVAIAPEELDARCIRVDTYLLAGELPAALAEARALEREFPHDRRVVQRLAALYQRLGQEAEAREMQRRLLSLPEAVERPRR
jgi:tetratricopeptide (TPR) repeat protein